MKGLPTLLRLHRQRLDEARASLSRLEAERSRILARERKLEEEFRAERARPLSPEIAYVFLAYSAMVARQREAIAREKAEIAAKIDAVKGRIHEAFQEFKKFDIGHRRQQERAAAEGLRRERGVLDEIGLDIFRRRGAAGNFTR